VEAAVGDDRIANVGLSVKVTEPAGVVTSVVVCAAGMADAVLTGVRKEEFGAPLPTAHPARMKKITSKRDRTVATLAKYYHKNDPHLAGDGNCH
jgi:hypothetical protein